MPHSHLPSAGMDPAEPLLGDARGPDSVERFHDDHLIPAYPPASLFSIKREDGFWAHVRGRRPAFTTAGEAEARPPEAGQPAPERVAENNPSCPVPDLPAGYRCDGCDCDRAGEPLKPLAKHSIMRIRPRWLRRAAIGPIMVGTVLITLGLCLVWLITMLVASVLSILFGAASSLRDLWCEGGPLITKAVRELATVARAGAKRAWREP